MPDQFTPSERSKIMRSIKSKDTSLEKKVRSALYRRGLRFRITSNLLGKPDIIFRKAHLVIFIDSCFWHGCSLHLRIPKTHRDYWEKKINSNVARDLKINIYYQTSDWHFLRVWEHELKLDFNACIDQIELLVKQYAVNG